MRKGWIFLQKQWTNPFGKFRFIDFFKTFFSALKTIVFYLEYL